MYQSSYLLGYGTGRTGEYISVWSDGDPAGKLPVVACHGFLGTALQWYDDQIPLIARGLAAAGFVVLCPDLGLNVDPRYDGQNNWGHDDCVDPGGSIDDSLDFAVDEYGCRDDKAGITGTSMGGTAAAWIWRNVERFAAAAFTIPCLATAALRAQNPLGIGTYMDLAFSLEGGFTASVPTHDPSHPDNVAQLIPVADRIRAWYSSNDNIINPADVVAFGEATGVEVTNVGAVGHSLNWDQQQVLDWFVPRLRAS